MITLTIPVLPTIAAIAFLIGFIFITAEEGGGWPAGFVTIISPVFVFFLLHGVMTMFGGY